MANYSEKVERLIVESITKEFQACKERAAIHFQPTSIVVFYKDLTPGTALEQMRRELSLYSLMERAVAGIFPEKTKLHTEDKNAKKVFLETKNCVLFGNAFSEGVAFRNDIIYGVIVDHEYFTIRTLRSKYGPTGDFKVFRVWEDLGCQLHPC